MSCERFVLLGCVTLFMDNIELIATFLHASCCGCTVDQHEPYPSNILQRYVLFFRNYNRLCLFELKTTVLVLVLGPDYYFAMVCYDNYSDYLSRVAIYNAVLVGFRCNYDTDCSGLGFGLCESTAKFRHHLQETIYRSPRLQSTVGQFQNQRYP